MTCDRAQLQALPVLTRAMPCCHAFWLIRRPEKYHEILITALHISLAMIYPP